MNLLKCSNGHFYDGDKYPSCPHCSGGGTADSAFAQESSGNTVNYDNPDYSYSDSMKTVPGAGIGGVDDNIPFGSGFPTQPTVPGFNAGSVGTDDPDVLGIKGEEDDLATQRDTFKPVVGWLVVTGGEERGRSKTLSYDRNFIGRDSSMDVVLGDKSVSRIKHAIITFEPNSQTFYIGPGESHELFYVNNEVVLSNIKLNAYDVIKIGKTELVFVPFCGENFSWKE